MSDSKVLSFVGIICLAVCGFASAVPQWCPDLATDDRVDFFDFAVLADNWKQSGSSLEGDFDNSGMVDINDLGYLVAYWSRSYECRNADFNFDYTINFLDFAKLAEVWLSDSNDAGWNDAFDLDYSNFIDINDLDILCYRWLKTYPEPNDAFDSFKNALASGNIETALTFVAESSKTATQKSFRQWVLIFPILPPVWGH